MKTFRLGERSVLGLLMLVLLVGVWATPAVAAPSEQRDFIRLEYGLKRALLRADVLQDRIDNLSAGADLVAEFVADEQNEGHDTSSLEEALATFRVEVGAAQEALNTAVRTLEDKVGFNENGEVVEPQQARETLKTAHRPTQDARQTLFSAVQDLRQAMRDYLQDRRAGQ